MEQFINPNTGETVLRNPGQQLPYGGTWQQVGGSSNPMGGGAYVPQPTYPSTPAYSSPTPTFGTPQTPSWETPTYTPSSGVTSGYGSLGASVRTARAPFLNRYQSRMMTIGFVLGFVLGVIPFFVRGLGFYSSYPVIVGCEVGLALGAVFCAYALIAKKGDRHFAKAAVVLGGTWVLFRFLPFVPFVRLFRSLLRIP